MTERFIFWAQALDNSSPDHIEMHGEELPADDAVRRQEAVSLVSRALKSCDPIFEEQGVKLTVDAHHFVLEVLSVQRDRAGRSAPIICYGAYCHEKGDVLGTSVAVGLSEFAKRIGRTIQPKHFELSRDSFVALKKKISKQMIIRQATIGVGVLALIILVYWLASRR